MRVGIGAGKSGYWMHLADYMQRMGIWQVELFTEEEMLKDALESGRIDFLFLERGMYEEKTDSVPIAYFGEGEGEISCYQKGEKILEEMQAHLEGSVLKTAEEGTSIYGVYSPIGRSGKTSFSLALAKAHSFFYIGMEEYGIKGKERDKMGELLYHIHNRKEGIKELLEELSEEWQGIGIIPSPMFFSDVHHLNAEDFQWFIQEIRKAKEVPSVIIDFGTGALDHMEVLEFFDKVFVPILPGAREEEKLRQFRELFQEINGNQTEKIRYIQVPDLPWDQDGFLEQVVEIEKGQS